MRADIYTSWLETVTKELGHTTREEDDIIYRLWLSKEEPEVVVDYINTVRKL